jgi:hypothetical protein
VTGRILAALAVADLRERTRRPAYLVTLAAAVAVPAGLVKPSGASTALLLPAAWIWPMLIWSRLGTQRHENGLDTLLGACPGARRGMGGWAGAHAAAGIGPLIRMAIAADPPGVAAWAAGALFIPSLALLLGTASRTHRMFQALYVILWYAAVNQVGRPVRPVSARHGCWP